MNNNKDIIIEARNLKVNYLVQKEGMGSIKDYLLSFGTKSMFEQREILKGIDLEVKRGECLGLVGKNGSGKSTLLRTLAGIIQPSSGFLEVRGRVAPMLAFGVGLEREFSGYDNIKLCGTLMGLSNKQINSSIKSIVEFTELGDDIHLQVKRYSSGMMARLSFSIAVAHDPEILIVDEALAVGDSGFREKCWNRVNEIRKSGSTIIYVSHSDEEITKLCDRAVFLKDGKIQLSGTPEEVMPVYLKEFKNL